MPEPDPETLDAGAATYSVSLPTFEGPLDLLLHLCQKHELDILDIPISFVTEKYLEYLAVLQLINLDVASEYLLMAATLAHIKSKMLLPAPPPGQEDEADEFEEDPREALIRRLLEYQKYKQAAADLAALGITGKDIFTRGVKMEEAVNTGLAPLAEVPLYSLVEAFQAVLSRTKVKIAHDVVADRISITDRIHELLALFGTRKRLTFETMFDGLTTKLDLVITFLAILEMSKLRLTRLFQTAPLAPLYIELAALDDGTPRTEDEAPEEEGAQAAEEGAQAAEEAPVAQDANVAGDEEATAIADEVNVAGDSEVAPIADEAQTAISAPLEEEAIAASDAEPPHADEAQTAISMPFAEEANLAGDPEAPHADEAQTAIRAPIAEDEAAEEAPSAFQAASTWTDEEAPVAEEPFATASTRSDGEEAPTTVSALVIEEESTLGSVPSAEEAPTLGDAPAEESAARVEEAPSVESAALSDDETLAPEEKK